MYAYFDGEKWICDLAANEIKNLAKNGTIKQETLIRLPDGREVPASKFNGLEFGKPKNTISVPDPIVVPTIDTSRQHQSDSPKSFHPIYRNYIDMDQDVRVLAVFIDIIYCIGIIIGIISVIIGFYLLGNSISTLNWLVAIAGIVIICVNMIYYRVARVVLRLITMQRHIAEDLCMVSQYLVFRDKNDP